MKKEDGEEVKAEDELKQEPAGEDDSSTSAKDSDTEYIDKIAVLTAELTQLQSENRNLHEQATGLHQKHHSTTLKVLTLVLYYHKHWLVTVL